MSKTTSPGLRALYAGLVLTTLVSLAPLIDLATVDSIGDHVRAAYPDWSSDLVRTDRNAIVGYFAVANALGIPLWLWTSHLAATGHRRTRAVATWCFAAGACLAITNLGMGGAAYDTVVPVAYGLLGLAPVAAGLAALVPLWRGRAEVRQ